MKLLSLVFIALAAALAQAAPLGIDVSSFQPNVNWATVKANGIQFVYIKATEGTGRCASATAQFSYLNLVI